MKMDKLELTERDRIRLLKENIKLKNKLKGYIDFLEYVFDNYPLKDNDYLKIDIGRKLKRRKS